MATSGNYRDFYTKDGRKYVHIIDPRSGENKESTLASATIIAQDCATADAYATACIVLGLEESIAIINELPEVEGCFITFDDGTYNLHFTEHFNQYINE
jgi:thiamine biosynthesis lipoprotein